MSTAEDTTIGAQVERLTLAAAGKTVEIGGRHYSTTKLYDPRVVEHQPPVIRVATLQAIAEYLSGGIDKAYFADRRVFVHVESPTAVVVYTGIFGEHNQRAPILAADAVVPNNLHFGTFLDPESFVIMLLAHFEPGQHRDIAQKIVGNLTTEAVQVVEDDGLTQRATAKSGITRVANVEIKNPFILRPYRSFAEIGQVESDFVLRLRGGGEGRLPQVALFEADGGKWRLDAVQRIASFIRSSLSGSAVVPVYC